MDFYENWRDLVFSKLTDSLYFFPIFIKMDKISLGKIHFFALCPSFIESEGMFLQKAPIQLLLPYVKKKNPF